MSKMALALEVLNDGKWHEKKELQNKLKLKDAEVEKMTEFFEKFGFVQTDNKGLKIKHNQKFQDLQDLNYVLM